MWLLHLVSFSFGELTAKLNRMKITGVTKIECFIIETDEAEYCSYTRYSNSNWMVRMGESDETLYDTEEIDNLEKLYQQWMAENES